MGDAKKQLKAMQAAQRALVSLERDEQVVVLDLLARNLGLTPVADPSTPAPVAGTPPPPAASPTSAKAFMAQKKPQTEIERMTCLAYYLSHYGNMPKFKTRDLTNLAKGDAAQPRFTNAAQSVKDAAKAKYFAPAGSGQKQMTTRGDALVEALPDRERVKKALEEHVIGRPRKTRRKAKRATA